MLSALLLLAFLKLLPAAKNVPHSFPHVCPITKEVRVKKLETMTSFGSLDGNNGRHHAIIQLSTSRTVEMTFASG